MNGTLIGLKSMDEGKHNMVGKICRALTSYKYPPYSHGVSLRRLRDSSFNILRMNLSTELIIGGQTSIRNFSNTVQCVNRYTMRHPNVQTDANSRTDIKFFITMTLF